MSAMSQPLLEYFRARKAGKAAKKKAEEIASLTDDRLDKIEAFFIEQGMLPKKSE